MSIVRTLPVYLSLYASGLVLYASLFSFTENQSESGQILKILTASAYSLVFALPAFWAQSAILPLRWAGRLILAAYFVYVFFLIGYFTYFGFIPEVYAFGSSNVTDLAEVSGHYFRQIFGLKEIALILIAGLFFFFLKTCPLGKEAMVVLAIPVLLFGFSVAHFGAPKASSAFGNNSIIKRFGLVSFVYMSARDWMSFESGYIAAQTPYPGKVSEMLGPTVPDAKALVTVPDGVKRMILVQIESFDKEAIHATLNGKPVMPFVSGLSEKCLSYTNFFTPKSVGGSSDSEFSVATGLLPSSKRPSMRHADFADITTLYDLLRGQGIDLYFAHSNHIGFYGRNFAYAQMPDVTLRFLNKNEHMTERAFAEDSLSHALAESERFFYYFFNFQSHGPFAGYSEETAEELSIEERSDMLTNYLATMHEVDQTIETLFSLQRPDFERGESAFILTADHPSYLHATGDPIGDRNIPMLICHQSFEKTSVDKVSSTPDLFPTILEMFGIDPDLPFIGQSMFQDFRKRHLTSDRSASVSIRRSFAPRQEV